VIGAGGIGRVPLERRGSPPLVSIAVISILFLATRLAFLYTRPLFYDELFTRWLTARSPHGILDALRLDSGPPLFYLIAHLFSAVDPRWLSLVAATIGLSVVLGSGLDGRLRVRAALLLAVYPPAVFAAADGRAYALCSMFVAIGCLSLESWIEAAHPPEEEQEEEPGERPGSRLRLLLTVAAFVLAGYTHYYGVLFFPLPFVLALLARNRRRIAEGFIASAACGLLFAPGFLRMMAQPRGSMQWNMERNPLGAFTHLPFAAPYPPALIPTPSFFLILAALVVFAFSVMKTFRSPRATRFAVMTLVPAAIVSVAVIAGSRIYFPVRFEAVVAVPLLLWLATAVQMHSRMTRRLLVASMILIGLTICFRSAVHYNDDQADPYRSAALAAKEHLPPDTPIVASGYLYLEVVSARTPAWNPPVQAFPRDQAAHPGWRAQASLEELRSERDALLAKTPSVVWIGESTAPELRVLAEACEGHVMYTNAYVAIVKFEKKN
jgi:hypothetical protein